MEDVLVDVVLVVTEEKSEEVVEYVVVEELPEVEENPGLSEEEPLSELAVPVTAKELVPTKFGSTELVPPELVLPEEVTPPEENVLALIEELASTEPISPEEAAPGIEAVTFGIVCPVEIGVITLLEPLEAAP